MNLNAKIEQLAPVELFPELTAAQKEQNRLCVQIANEIYKRRKELNKTQQQLAKQFGVSQPMVCQWESGCYNFTIETLTQVFCQLDLKLDISFSYSFPHMFLANTYENSTSQDQNTSFNLIEAAA